MKPEVISMGTNMGAQGITPGTKRYYLRRLAALTGLCVAWVIPWD